MVASEFWWLLRVLYILWSVFTFYVCYLSDITDRWQMIQTFHITKENCHAQWVIIFFYLHSASGDAIHMWYIHTLTHTDTHTHTQTQIYTYTMLCGIYNCYCISSINVPCMLYMKAGVCSILLFFFYLYDKLISYVKSSSTLA